MLAESRYCMVDRSLGQLVGCQAQGTRHNDSLMLSRRSRFLLLAARINSFRTPARQRQKAEKRDVPCFVFQPQSHQLQLPHFPATAGQGPKSGYDWSAYSILKISMILSWYISRIINLDFKSHPALEEALPNSRKSGAGKVCLFG
jgi:hypothetical protein